MQNKMQDREPGGSGFWESWFELAEPNTNFVDLTTHSFTYSLVVVLLSQFSTFILFFNTIIFIAFLSTITTASYTTCVFVIESSESSLFRSDHQIVSGAFMCLPRDVQTHCVSSHQKNSTWNYLYMCPTNVSTLKASTCANQRTFHELEDLYCMVSGSALAVTAYLFMNCPNGLFVTQGSLVHFNTFLYVRGFKVEPNQPACFLASCSVQKIMQIELPKFRQLEQDQEKHTTRWTEKIGVKFHLLYFLYQKEFNILILVSCKLIYIFGLCCIPIGNITIYLKYLIALELPKVRKIYLIALEIPKVVEISHLWALQGPSIFPLFSDHSSQIIIKAQVSYIS
ncbi:hypothetical protein VP01_1621g2 [Puccinia sorghi]|uniref:Uncharacterized protein n=1 Tax=Puccinia sorghi TaxID=27349 RepID=A0A0L6VGY6_9BASI|nr:hypothetical protein VP01_1621g2 [Puccinia sorghi]